MEEKYFIDFTGGFNDTVPSDMLAPNELRDCENVIISKTRGGILKRPGCTKVNTNSFDSYATQVFEVSTSKDTYLYLITNDSGFDHTLSKMVFLGDINGPVSVKNNLGANIAWVVFQDQMYFIDHHNAKYYALDLEDVFLPVTEVTPDPDTTNDLAPIKNCEYLVWHQPSMRFFAAGNYLDPTALYFSEVGKPNFFKSTNKIYPAMGLGPIIGISVINDSILVAYKNGWYHFTGTFPGIDAVWKPLPIQSGLLSSKAMSLTPETLTFLSNEALYIFSPSILSDNYAKVVGESSFADISSGKVRNTLLSINKNYPVKLIYFDRMVFIAYANRPYVAGDNDYCDKVLVMDWDTKTFTKFTGWKIYDWCVFGDSLYIASDNYILKYDHISRTALSDIDVLTGEKKAIDMKVWTNSYNLSSYHNKTIYEMFISTEHNSSNPITNMILTPDQNYGNSIEFEIKNNVPGWVGGSIYANNKVQINKTGIRHQLYINDNNLDNYLFIAVIGFIYEYLSDSTNGEAIQDLLISD